MFATPDLPAFTPGTRSSSPTLPRLRCVREDTHRFLLAMYGSPRPVEGEDMLCQDASPAGLAGVLDANMRLLGATPLDLPPAVRVISGDGTSGTAGVLDANMRLIGVAPWALSPSVAVHIISGDGTTERPDVLVA